MSYAYRLKCRIKEEGIIYTARYATTVFFTGIYSLIKNAMLDLLYSGRLLNGNKKTPYRHLGANDTYHTDYSAMSIIFKQVHISASDVLVDVGCGKGRIINYWISQSLKNEIYGLELDPTVAAETALQFKKYSNIHILQGDAIANLPPEGTIFYFYNPFMLEKVIEFEKKLSEMPRSKAITVIYYNPKSIDVFRNSNWNIRSVQFGRDLGIERWGRLNKYHDLAVITSKQPYLDP